MSRAITSHVKPALRTVARRETYFTKREIVREVLRRADIAEAVIEIRRAYRGRGLDEAVLSFIDVEVGKALRQRDPRGLRLFECYTDGREKRWRRFTEMRLADVERVTAELEQLRDRLDAKVRAYTIVMELLRERGPDASVAEVYDRAWARIVTAAVPLEKIA